MTPLAVAGELGGFIQWRPVAYTLPERDIESSTETKYYTIRNSTHPDKDFNNTLLFAFYGYSLESQLAQALNLSFGAVSFYTNLFCSMHVCMKLRMKFIYALAL